MLDQLDQLHALAGFIVGLLVGMTGVGGGSLMTPLLVLMFGVSPQTAVGTDLLYAAITKITGTTVHGWRDTVDWKIVRRLAYGSIPATILTLAVMARLGKVSDHSQHIILFSLAVLLAITACTVIFRARLARFAQERGPLEPGSRVTGATVLLGAAIGIAVSISSVGAGAIGVTVLLMLYPRLPMVRIVGSDIAHAVPLALIAGVGHWIIGDVDGVLLTNLLVGSIPGVIIGSLLSTRAPEWLLRPLLAIVLGLSSWQLFVKAATPSETAAKSSASSSEGALAASRGSDQK
ncbi:sulfite exporter TauE/SafE family protein [Novosphingobium pentaromativorans]|uniref:Probable membrane transporter protein n=1 Tax=Novosphingobium pentaromativorans US6-1 TaxID=1088721 RepID=G6EHD7_9SPHN|nr:sulfite exporter TauE/SafE family protein [Novosphingobium pentaromativorans]AIT81905.1 membrane protein [Novosphingobium pentaromativorans US6-1]EHJ59426.1 hypothetical protein NSU_3758 [Novosphingobium pentaromativorans US6-1]